MPTTNPDVDKYMRDAAQWKEEQKALRELLLDSGLVEEYKWKQPCYTLNGKNVAAIGAFKNECRIGFFKGALLKDTHNMLTSPGKNSQSSRQLVFTSVDEIRANEKAIKQYIQQAIDIEQSGKEVKMKTTDEFEKPDELIEMMNQNAAFKEAFEALTSGRQRGYILYFSGAKKSETRHSRIENSMDKIFAGKGMQDCVCGKSKKYPRCDGSHSK